MNILLLLIPLSLVLLGVAIWAFVWAVQGGQFDDLDTPALDILVDDDMPNPDTIQPVDPDGDAEISSPDPARPDAGNAD